MPDHNFKTFLRLFGLFWKGRRVTWGDEANEKQWPHSAAGANCWEGGRRWQKLQLTDPVSYCCLRHPRALIKVLYHLSHAVKSTRPRTVSILVLPSFTLWTHIPWTLWGGSLKPKRNQLPLGHDSWRTRRLVSIPLHWRVGQGPKVKNGQINK